MKRIWPFLSRTFAASHFICIYIAIQYILPVEQNHRGLDLRLPFGNIVAFLLALLSPAVMLSRLAFPFSTASIGFGQAKEKSLMRFLAYMLMLLSKADRASDVDNGLQELREAVHVVSRNEAGMQNLIRQTTAGGDTFQDIEGMDFNQLRSFLEEVAVKSSSTRNTLERELLADRFVTAYCTLKDLASKCDALKRQHSKHRTMDTTRTSVVSISSRKQDVAVIARGPSQRSLSIKQGVKTASLQDSVRLNRKENKSERNAQLFINMHSLIYKRP